MHQYQDHACKQAKKENINQHNFWMEYSKKEKEKYCFH
jgi:hypothetical protein